VASKDSQSVSVWLKMYKLKNYFRKTIVYKQVKLSSIIIY